MHLRGTWVMSARPWQECATAAVGHLQEGLQGCEAVGRWWADQAWRAALLDTGWRPCDLRGPAVGVEGGQGDGHGGGLLPPSSPSPLPNHVPDLCSPHDLGRMMTVRKQTLAPWGSCRKPLHCPPRGDLGWLPSSGSQHTGCSWQLGGRWPSCCSHWQVPSGQGAGTPPLTTTLGGVSAAKLPTGQQDSGQATPTRSDPVCPCLARRHCPPLSLLQCLLPALPGHWHLVGLSLSHQPLGLQHTLRHGGLLWHRPSHLPLLLPDASCPDHSPTCQHLGQVRAHPRHHPALALALPT